MTRTTRYRIRCLFAQLALAILMATPLVAVAATAERAASVLEEVRTRYAGTGSFHETLELELEMPDGARGSRRQDYGVDGQGGAFYRLESDGREGLRIVAREGRIVASWAHIPERYAEREYSGDLAAALEALEAPQVQLWAPPSIVAAQGADARAFLRALRFGILEPVEPVSAREVEGESIVEIELRAANGHVVLGVDRVTNRFATVRFVLGEGAGQVRATGTFSMVEGEPVDEMELPGIEGRVSVPTLTALEASKYPIGEAAPRITVASLEGVPVDLGALVGNVVVLDFWATWCVPCWSALEHTEALTAWAKSSGLPVRVFAVDSLERGGGVEIKRRRAREFLTSRDLEVDVLLDHDDRAFAAFHNPGLPSLVIVDQGGDLVDYHSGVLEDMTEVIESRVLELLGSQQ